MTVHEHLAADHTLLRNQIAEIQHAVTKAPGKVAELYALLHAEIRKHLQKEDLVYYRVLDGNKQITDRNLMHDLRNDHAAVLFALESLAIKLRKAMPIEEWSKKFKTMTDVFLPHLDQEEKQLFPQADRLLSPTLHQQILDEIQKLA